MKRNEGRLRNGKSGVTNGSDGEWHAIKRWGSSTLPFANGKSRAIDKWKESSKKDIFLARSWVSVHVWVQSSTCADFYEAKLDTMFWFHPEVSIPVLPSCWTFPPQYICHILVLVIPIINSCVQILLSSIWPSVPECW